MYSDGMGQGTGEEYPRDPTLLIQAPVFDDSKFGSRHILRRDVLWEPESEEDRQYVTPVQMEGPMSVSFNTGKLRHELTEEAIYVTGRWSDLQLMQVGMAGHRVTRVGFPDTLIKVGRAPEPDSD